MHSPGSTSTAARRSWPRPRRSCRCPGKSVATCATTGQDSRRSRRISSRPTTACITRTFRTRSPSSARAATPTRPWALRASLGSDHVVVDAHRPCQSFHRPGARPGGGHQLLRLPSGHQDAVPAATSTFAKGIHCGDCHGAMAVVGDPRRTPWVDEPKCADCHNVPGHQYEEPGKLFKQSRGHNGVMLVLPRVAACDYPHRDPHRQPPGHHHPGPRGYHRQLRRLSQAQARRLLQPLPGRRLTRIGARGWRVAGGGSLSASERFSLLPPGEGAPQGRMRVHDQPSPPLTQPSVAFFPARRGFESQRAGRINGPGSAVATLASHPCLSVFIRGSFRLPPYFYAASKNTNASNSRNGTAGW